jgi:hypothetical protein
MAFRWGLMKSSAVACVRHLMDEYRHFLRSSYRFLDDYLRQQFEDHLAQADVVVGGKLPSAEAITAIRGLD